MKERIENFRNKEKYNVDDVRELVEILRSDDGCAWDREQTNKSIRNAIIEETYEFIEGLDNDDRELMKEELGDVFFQVFFHARILEEDGFFNVDDVADGICKKMVLRHPHVFGDVVVKNSAEVLNNWDIIKKSEKHRDSAKKELESVSVTLPSLIRAQKLLSKYKKEGGYVEKDKNILFDNIEKALEKAKEGLDEKTLGELLFKIANLSYASDINSEEALYHYNNGFVSEKSAELENK
ncbi:MAG: MazG family protein [Clostridiales bacterium]|nr:MazG family protein [Clostridiales bacterium]